MRRSVLAALVLSLACGGGDSGGPSAPTPAKIAVFSGDSQTAIAGHAVAAPPTVLVTDAADHPVEGATVTFSVNSGNGQITGPTATTGTDGLAHPGSWKLHTRAGPDSMTAVVTGLAGHSAVIHAVGIAGPPGKLARSSGNNQTAAVDSAVSIAPAVLVTDSNDNPVGGIAVAFAVTAGGGSVTGPATASGSNGLATVGSWKLGSLTGPNSLTATSPAIAGVSAVFSATASAGPPVSIVAADTLAATAAAGSVIAAFPAVLIKDAHGNPAGGVIVAVAITAGNGQVVQASVTTAPNGIATAGPWTLDTVAGHANGLHFSTLSIPATSVLYSVTSIAGPPARMVPTSPTAQRTPAGLPVRFPPTVLITDRFGNSVTDCAIHFLTFDSQAPGGGGAARTDQSGLASVPDWIPSAVRAFLPFHLIAHADSAILGSVEFAASTTGQLWIGGTSSDWYTQSNWFPAIIPTDTSTVEIGAGAHDPIITGALSLANLRLHGGNMGPNGHTIAVADSLSVDSPSLLLMTNPSDEVVVVGPAVFGGGDETGHMTAGVLRVTGGLAVAGLSSGALAGSGTHRTILDGTNHPLVQFTSAIGSYFGDLEIVGNPQFLDLVSIGGRLYLDANSEVAGGQVNLDGLLTTASGSSFKPDHVYLNTDSLNVLPGTFTPGVVHVVGGATIPDMTYTQLRILVPGQITLLNDLSIGGDFFIDHGNLVMNGHTIRSNIFAVFGDSSYVTMAQPQDSLDAVAFRANAGDQTGHMTAGTLVARQAFVQVSDYSAKSFVSSGSHRTILGDAGPEAVAVTLQTPGAAASFFNDVDIAGAQIDLFSPITVNGTFRVPPGSQPQIAGTVLATTNAVDIRGATFSLARLFITGPVVHFDSVAFINVQPGDTSLAISAPGSAGPITIHGLTFPAPPSAPCSYLKAVDTDGLAPAMAIDITSNLTPAEGAGCTSTAGGPGPVQAVVNWH